MTAIREWQFQAKVYQADKQVNSYKNLKSSWEQIELLSFNDVH